MRAGADEGAVEGVTCRKQRLIDNGRTLVRTVAVPSVPACIRLQHAASSSQDFEPSGSPEIML